MLTIGSYALLAAGIDPGRVPNDRDYIGTHQAIQRRLEAICPAAVYPVGGGRTLVARIAGGRIHEYEIAWPGTTSERILELTGTLGDVNLYASPEMCLLLKLSHRYLRNSPHFLKTRDDINLLRRRGVKVRDEWLPLLKEREKETYTYRHPDLNQPKAGFFSRDGLTYVWDHDDVHRAVAAPLQPAYRAYMKDGAEVACDRVRFEALALDHRLRGVAEEAMVLAIERSLVPYPGMKTPTEAFTYALQKVCTSITSGWFREFAWEHYDEVLAWYRNDGRGSYWARFEELAKTGFVKKHGE
jgi:hypothetical protein